MLRLPHHRLPILGALCMLGSSACRIPAPTAAAHLFVSDHGGRVTVLRVSQGQVLGTAATAELGEPLRFLALAPEGRVLYALGRERLHALAWDPVRGELQLLGSSPTRVDGTHLALDPRGAHACVATYGGHAVALLALEPDGAPGTWLQTLGGGDASPYRNAHQVRFHGPSGAVHVPSLGSDRVAVLHLDRAQGELTDAGAGATPEGAGPRHMDYHPTLPVAYVLNERASSVTVFEVDASTGALTPRATVTTLPAGFDGNTSRSSDLHVAPDGRVLFAINREPLNDVVTFTIRPNGDLEYQSRVPTGGDHARTFAVDPSGTWLYVANTRSRDLTLFSVEPDGRLERLETGWSGDSELSCVVSD